MTHDLEVMRICVKAYLRDIRSYYAAILQNESKLQTKRESLELRSARLTGMPSAPPMDDKTTQTFSLIAELEQSWQDQMEQHFPDIERAYLLCFDPPNLARRICWEKYVESLTWNEVARRHAYSERQTRYIADKGVIELYSEIPEEYRRYSIPNAVPL